MKGASGVGPLIAGPRLGTVVSFMLVILLGCADHLRCDVQMEPHLPPSEMEALRAIAFKLEISSDVWDFNLNPCSQRGGWVNVPPFVQTQTNTVISNLSCGKCDPNTNLCHVVSILLKSMNLTGVLPEEFANLTHLTILDLSRNVIRGSLPAAWRSLPLVNITLIGNRISGVIPDEIGDISSIYYLSLEDNLLEGGLPKSFGRFRNLSRLLLSCNDFVGELPEALGNITSLKDFRIDGTGISGKIPSFIGNWLLLKRLDMQGTSLEGSFPSTLSNLKNLMELRVSDFKGDGTFPPLQNMNLQILILRNCSIFGRIPDYIGLMNNLQTLDLSFNKFSGEIPPAFRLQIQTINYIYLTDNMLNGTIPEWMFGNKLIDLSYNSFTGPDKGSCEKNYVNLVSSLSFSGNLSTTWCLMKNLPCSKKSTNYELFINCGGGSVTIDGNDYEEDINGLGESMFFLSNNQRWAYSSTGDFVGNRNAKYAVTNASALKMNNPQLYLSARTAASSLRYYGLCLQRGNYTVKLHFAEIIFTDDKTFSSVGRRFFDVFIQGRKVLEDFNIAEAANGTAREVVKSFIASVNNTIEIHFRWSGKGTNAIPDRGVYGPLVSAISITPNFVPIRHTKKGFPVGKMVAIVLTSCVVIFLATLVPWLLLYKKRKENKELKHFKLQGAHFTLSQIKVATRNFDSANKIGEGGFGPVYKGVFPDGSVIAVKQLSSMSRQGNREFLNEIGMISALQHPNLVKLHGCCIEGNQLLLIYEYLENNSLARALFGPEETRLALEWQTRWKITLDIARGLAYLHEESRLKIVHRDIKSNNVLLDKDLNAKISDFGLAKLDDERHTHIFTKVAGTIGYMAPEYATRGYLTEKADVYSFGIVVLEIVSGKGNMSCRSEDFPCLLDFANTLNEQGKLLDLVDPKLGLNYSKSEAEQLLSLSLLCTNNAPKLRPTMTSVVRIMGGEPITDVKSVNENSQISLKSFGNYSQSGQELSSNGPWIDSSMTINSFGDAVPTSIGSMTVSSIVDATASSHGLTPH